MYRWVRWFHAPGSRMMPKNTFIPETSQFPLFHKLDLIMFKSALLPLWSPQWDRAPGLPPNTVRAGDAHPGQWTESVHLTEARAGSGLPEQTPRLLQLSLHLLSGTSSSRRSWGNQTRKLRQNKKKTFVCFFLPHFTVMTSLQWWTPPLRWGCQFWFSLKVETKTWYFCPFEYGLYQFCSQVSMFRMASESIKWAFPD